MADDWTRNIVCRYYKNGLCREGDNCRYLHTSQQSGEQDEMTDVSESNNNTNTTEQGASQVPCRFFKWGTCKFGNRCRYGHASSTSPGMSAVHSDASQDIDSLLSSTSNTNNYEPTEWVKAPVFIPNILASMNCNLEDGDDSNVDMSSIKTTKPESYARAVNNTGQTLNPASEPLCPYAESSGRSRSKACGVCFEVIMEKTSREQRRFGILPNCNHCFCLSCIRKWRQAKQFDNKIIRSCPECRISSDFVCPSIYWVDTKEEKEKLIVEYKGALSQKDCKYFNKGQGKCPFGNKCFYLHALPDGTKADVGPPARQASHSSGEIDFLQQLILWNFLEERDNRWIYMDDHDEVVVLFSDSEDSVW
ncbi:hypothetical protein G9C98_000076 [Cotesia typhae]|uniref:RING-type E3 ubiquitin transferase n=1 Tax=Cotesia typhae TaxID=2053667 RepID=A0A8J5RB97_9HYME|nr:hypothetical protein G9C98_000076 [Cotesia typhae]